MLRMQSSLTGHQFLFSSTDSLTEPGGPLDLLSDSTWEGLLPNHMAGNFKKNLGGREISCGLIFPEY